LLLKFLNSTEIDKNQIQLGGYGLSRRLAFSLVVNEESIKILTELENMVDVKACIFKT